MKKHTIHLLAAAVSSIVCAAPTVVSAKTFTESLQQGSSVKVNVRTRFEDVTQDKFNSSDELEADAWTTRLRLTYQSGAWNGFGVFAEMDDVSEMTNQIDYKDAPQGFSTLDDPTKAGDTAVIADPVGTELNQGFISYTTFNNQVKVGRQRLVLDNSRFIGNVGWRQNEQTYDGVSITDKTIRYTNFTYAYIKNVNKVFGEDNPLLSEENHESHVLNASYTGFESGKLIGYAYLLDVNGPFVTSKNASSDTYGIRWQGTINDMFLYNLEYAKQQDAGLNQAFDADYILAEGVANISRYSFTLGYEVLGSDDGKFGFATPLATLHAFNGWADKFLTTPTFGLEDKYLNVGVTFAGAQAIVSYHKYDADEGDNDYGDEINFSLSKKFGAVVWTAKYADYKEGDALGAGFTDTTKFWVMADWNF